MIQIALKYACVFYMGLITGIAAFAFFMDGRNRRREQARRAAEALDHIAHF